MSLIFAIALLATDAPVVIAPPKIDGASRLEKMNSLLSGNEFRDLNKILLNPSSKNEFDENLNWLRSKWIEGNSLYISVLYSQILWQYTSGIYQAATELNVTKDSNPQDIDNYNKLVRLAESTRGTVVASMLYYYGVIPIDGARCGDKTSLEYRINQFPTIIPEFMDYISQISEADQKLVIDIALDIEAKSAKRRASIEDAVFLCSQGMEALQFGIRRGTTTEAAPKPGQIGRQVGVDTDGYKPRILEEKIWQPIASQARSEMRGRLERLFARLKASKK